MNQSKPTENDKELFRLAKEAAENAYAPFSRYQVGAALLAEDGRVFTGCNVENSSYGGTICAERTAAVKAVSEGQRKFKRIVIASRGEDYCYPCGACRQVLREFGPEMEVICLNGKGEARRFSLEELLPCSFGPDHL